MEVLKAYKKLLHIVFLIAQEQRKSLRQLLEGEQSRFYRYNFFFANYLIDKGKKEEAESIVDLTLKKFPRNLLINQLKEDLKTNIKKSE